MCRINVKKRGNDEMMTSERKSGNQTSNVIRDFLGVKFTLNGDAPYVFK